MICLRRALPGHKWRVRQKIRSRLHTIDGKGPWPGFGWSPRAARRGRQLLRIGLRRSSLLLGEFSKPARCRNPERREGPHSYCSEYFKESKGTWSGLGDDLRTFVFCPETTNLELSEYMIVSPGTTGTSVVCGGERI